MFVSICTGDSELEMNVHKDKMADTKVYGSNTSTKSRVRNLASYILFEP